MKNREEHLTTKAKDIMNKSSGFYYIYSPLILFKII